jgi:serine/arginine repetitive matrix protein 2
VTSTRSTKLNDKKEADETAAAHKQARMEEADTFRGVHLDPNAHHWDEVSDDDNVTSSNRTDTLADGRG